MNRAILRTLLEAYTPTPDEASFKTIMLDFIEKYPNCFERSLSIGHITASCWLINKNNTHALLTHHAKLDKWFQLGGHCDGHTNVLEVAIKEAQEESGTKAISPVSNHIFDIDIHLIPSNKKEVAHFHYDVRFLLQMQTDEFPVPSDESKALQWIEKDIKALPTDNPSVVRLFNKWIQYSV